MAKYLITGGSSGIGLSICRALTAADNDLINISRRPCPLHAARINNISLDLSKPSHLDSEFKELAKKHEDLAGLILCAGQGVFRMLEEFSLQNLQRLMDTNFTSHALLLKHLLPTLKKRQQGKIIILGSESALQGGKQGSIYCASKFALRGLALSLRQECAKSGVTVSIINPGMVDSPFFADQHFRPGPEIENSIATEDVAKAVLMILNAGPGANIDEINLSPLKKVIEFGDKNSN